MDGHELKTLTQFFSSANQGGKVGEWGGGLPITHDEKIKWNINYINKYPIIIVIWGNQRSRNEKKGQEVGVILCFENQTIKILRSPW